ncbi:MAG: ATP-binding protein, partial [Rhodococcus sp. (in: high G+C Gram-positive bacteria)]
MAPDARTAAAALTVPDSRVSALGRLTRFITRFVSAGAAAYLVLLVPQIVNQQDSLQSWYTPVFVVAIFVPALSLWFVSFRYPVFWIRRVVTIMAVGYLAAQISWIPAFDGPKLDVSASAWVSSFPGLMSLATAIAWRPVFVTVYLLVVAPLGQVINYYSRIDHGHVPLVSDIVFGIMFCGIFTLTVGLVLRTGRVLDRTRVVAEEQAASSAASDARSVERERFDALIHDDVMSTLLAAARSGNDPALARQAEAALDRLESLRSGSGDAEPMTPTSFGAYLRSALTRIDENIAVDVSMPDRPAAHEPDLPSVSMDAARALTAAAAEALRNSVRHAGDAARGVRASIRPSAAHVMVSDDGPGFDPTRVPPHRLGISVSIT